MTEVAPYLFIMLISAFVAACSQILLKRAAKQPHKNKWSEYLNIRVLAAYIIFIFSAGASMFVLRYIPLSLAVIISEPSGYVFVAVLSFVFLSERLNKKQISGMIFIITGIIISSI